MRWKSGRRSTNVEDRRGQGIPRGVLGAGGLGGVLLLVLFAVLSGKDPTRLLAELGQGVQQPGEVVAASPEEQELADFVHVVLADTEDVWQELFADMGQRYEEPRLVLFRDAVESACGTQSSAVGPFYCPGDARVNLDLSFFEELARAHGAAGDFAQAYVIAHEVGHHVQNLLGTSEQVHRLQGGLDETGANQLSVRLELQADFYAGVWAHHAQHALQVLEPGDLEEALNAASRIGDDRLQRESRGYVTPDSFTHGTSQQRQHWFRLGFETGDPAQGNTFDARDL